MTAPNLPLEAAPDAPAPSSLDALPGVLAMPVALGAEGFTPTTLIAGPASPPDAQLRPDPREMVNRLRQAVRELRLLRIPDSLAHPIDAVEAVANEIDALVNDDA